MHPWMYVSVSHLCTHVWMQMFPLSYASLYVLPHTSTSSSLPSKVSKTRAHTETATPSHISNSLKHTRTHTPNPYTPPPLPSLAGTIKLHPAFSALSCSHVPILERNCSLPLNPTVADSINEVASQPTALHNTLITSVCLA